MRPLILLLAVLWLPLAGGPPQAEARGSATRQATLAKRLSAIIKKARLKSGQYGVVVRARGPGGMIAWTAGAETPLVPASAAKLLTAATVLDLLGPSHVFRTRLTRRGTLSSAGVLDGDLILHGAGDPSLSGRFFDGKPMTLPLRFAKAVAEAGIRRVRGALVLDEGGFDREYTHPDWTAADKRRWYGAPAGGLVFNDGCVDVSVRGATGQGRAAVILAAGHGPWTLKNSIKTVKGARAAVGGRWIAEGKTLELHGRVPPKGKASFHVPVRDPALFLGGAVLTALRGENVRVDGGVRHARDVDDARAGALIADHEAELPPALQVMNVRSQNVYASTLFKGAGVALEGVGSWASGSRAVQAMLRRRGIGGADRTDMRDGSGLSVKNKVSAGVLADVLHKFDLDLLRGPVLFDSLAISGVRGTLRKRLRSLKGRVHAKTGTLNDVRARALAGYVERPGKVGYVFAILLNGSRASSATIDDLVREIAR